MKKPAAILFFSTLSILAVIGQNSLPIPPLDTGNWIGGARTFDLLMANDSTEFLPGLMTPTAGYNRSFLGPTLMMHKDDSVVLNVTNQLGEITTTHWHGFHVPAIMDGGPHQMITTGSTWTATFNMINHASTFWYHPHHKPTFWRDPDGTGGQVHRGLAALIIVEDDITDALSIPKTYGVDDIPLIIQDRAFNPNGTFIEFLNLPALVVRTGDTMLVNGAITPTHNTHAQMIRFRILNASNGRSYYLGFSDNRNFYQIGSDGGLLAAPLLLNRVRISTAERVEIVVDFSADLGQTIHLLSYASELINIFPTYPPPLRDAMDTTDYRIMSFTVGPATTIPILTLPATLTTVPLYNATSAVNFGNPRPFEIVNGSPLATINGASMDLNVINETILLGDMEIWEVINTSGVAHPWHVHGSPFQVLSRSDGPVPANEQGWKDVVLVPGRANGQNGIVQIIKPFLDFADDTYPYMYHCHILEHEDRGMMGQYIVTEDTSSPPPSQDITLMSYNIGSSNWLGNRDSVVARIAFHNPDVFCAIEATGNKRPFLETSLPQYNLLQTFTNPNLSESHIFYKPNIFTVVDSGFAQMETYGGYTGPARYVNWARLEESASQNQFLVYASHFLFVFPANPDSGMVGQYRHADGMIQLMDQHSSLNIPMITVGDFNADSATTVMQFLLHQTPITFNTTTITNPIELDDSWYIANPNTLKPATVGNGISSIDWILTTPNTGITSALIDNQGVNPGGDYPSDHLPLLISFEFPAGCPHIENLSTSNITTSSAILNWDMVNGVQGYTVEGGVVGSSNVVSLNVAGDSINFLPVFGLSNQQSYYWHVQAICSAGLPATWSVYDTFTTNCYPPDSNWTDPITSSSARLNWTNAAGAAGYQIVGRRIGASWIQIDVGGGNTVQRDVFGLISNQSYEWAVRTSCNLSGTNTSSWTSLDTFTTGASRLGCLQNEMTFSSSEFGFKTGSDLNIYPNPFAITTKVEFQNPDGESFDVTLTDISGKVLQEYPSITSGSLLIDRQALPGGLYFIEISANSRILKGKVFVN